MKKVIPLLILLCNQQILFCQEDSTKTIPTVTVRAFGQPENAMTVADIKQVKLPVPGNGTSLVGAFNLIPGVRMEERSPGSYRINIRGSSLRSPFGVRNVKVYWNGIPVTTPGGDTYFNQFAINNFSDIHIFKGPASSMYGAGTGGLILMNRHLSDNPGVSANISFGSYRLQNYFLDADAGLGRFKNHLSYAYSSSNGYREQSAMKRINASWVTELKLNSRQTLHGGVLYTDLYYQTPGALTQKEFDQNPRSARPAAGMFPSAKEVNAAIWQKNILGGIGLESNLGGGFSNHTVLYGAYADIQNSAVRNFEHRKEPHIGGRTDWLWQRSWNDNFLQWNMGAEYQRGNFNIRVSDNDLAKPGALQTDDDVRLSAMSVYTQAILSLYKQWLLSAGVSWNKNTFDFTRQNTSLANEQRLRYNNEVAPRLSVSRQLKNNWDFLLTVSKGYSPPSTGEILPSTTILNPDLHAENGWDYELRASKTLFGNALRLGVTGFMFNVKDAIVQRRDASGADYFLNAGKILQRGLEMSAEYRKLFSQTSFVDRLLISASYAYSHFRYATYMQDDEDYSGNTLPGVPENSLMADLSVYTKGGVYIFVQYYNVAKIFLNDANDMAAQPYHLITCKLGWEKKFKTVTAQLYVGSDNLLNEIYSLGNDINAIGGRYFNAAPGRNFYTGLVLSARRR